MKETQSEFTLMKALFTNYLPVTLCITLLLAITLPQVVAVYLFAITRYGYLTFMGLKKPVEQVFDETNGNVFNNVFGVPKFLAAVLINVFSRPYNFLTMLVVLAYVCFNPLSLLVKMIFGPLISAFTLGSINSGLELAITALFVKMIYDTPSKPDGAGLLNAEPMISGTTGILMMLWLVHDEVLLVMPYLAPVLSVFTLPFVQMFIVTSSVYSFSSWITDNLYKCFTKVDPSRFSSTRSSRFAADDPASDIKIKLKEHIQESNPQLNDQEFDNAWNTLIGRFTKS